MKRLVVCADGTWNLRDQRNDETGKRRPTNVTKVARAVRSRTLGDGGFPSGVDQVVCYHDGIGTRGLLDRFSGGAFGDGMENVVRELYRFIVYNHEPLDEIYLFGFSRGAFTVRTLSGFMHKVGLIEKKHDYYVPDLYALYEEGRTGDDSEWVRLMSKIGRKVACPPIRFIGVWDTVGSLGAPGYVGQLFNRGKYEYHQVGLNEAIENAYHALAIDERRRPFQPTLWKRPSTKWDGVLEQAWFPGAHSNVGGGMSPDGLANEALHWIVEKASKLGLEFDDDYLGHFTPCFNSELHESMSVWFRPFGVHLRSIGKLSNDGEIVHQAAIDRLAYVDGYGESAENLKAYASPAEPGRVYAQTTRCKRGTPCP